MGTVNPLSSLTSTISSAATTGSGIDVNSTVAALVQAASAPIQALQTQQQQFSAQSSALTSINSELADLQSKISALQDPLGVFSAKSATSSQSGIVTASANSTAAAGNHTVVVSNLATTASYYTNELATGDTTFTGGTFNLQVGSGTAVPITVDSSNNTLNKLASAINNQNLGVTATVITDASGARLSIVSNTSGSAGDITISGNTTGLTFTKPVNGQNASLTVDGVPISSATNTVTGAINGVTLNLLSQAPGTPVSIAVSANSDGVTSAINDFVTSYNSLITSINQQFAFDPTTQTAQPLAGDSTLELLQQQLLSQISSSISGNNGFNTLASLGISVNNDGTLSVDSGTLSTALAGNFSDVQNFFQTGSTGFAQTFNSLLTNLTNSINGPLNVELNGISQSQSSLTDQINNLQDALNSQQQIWIQEYSQVSAELQQLPLTLEQINAQLGSIKTS